MEENAREVTTKVKHFEDQVFDSAYTKMDEAFGVWNLTQVIFDKYETAINVTAPTPRTFADTVHSDLASAEMQILVRMAEPVGEDISKLQEKMGKLERLFHFLLEKADERLIAIQLPPLREFLIWCSLIRGCPAARILLYEDGKEVIPDFLPIDPRWLTYEVGSKGFLWTNYKLFKTKAQLQDEFDYTPSGTSFFTPWLKKTTYPTLDYWKVENGKVYNSVLCDNEYIKDPEEYSVERIPVLAMPVPMSPPLVDPSGESVGGFGANIFSNKIAAYKLESQLVSIWATHAKKLANQPLLNYIDDEGLRLDRNVLDAGGILNLVRGKQELKEAPLKEISPTLVNLVSWIEGQIERSSLPNLNLGTPPASGTALNLIREAGARVYNPQVRNLNRFYAGICKMIEEQTVSNKLKIKVETEKEHKYFGAQVTPVDIKKPHIIKVEFTVKNPWMELDILQQADWLRRLGFPDKWIWEFVVKVPDPGMVGDLALIEMAENSPTLAKKKVLEVLAKYKRFEDAEFLTLEFDREERMAEMQAGGMPTGEAPPPRPEIPPEAMEGMI